MMLESKAKIFVVIPAYNAAETIEGVFARIPEEARHRVNRYIVVDDGSTDNTKEVLARLRVLIPNLVTLQHEKNRGYGATEKTLLRYAVQKEADITILLHSDGQYSPEKIPDLLKPLDVGQAELVQGSRMLDGGALKGGMPLYKYLANKCLTTIENLTFGMKMAEYHSGYMLYSKRALQQIPFDKLSNTFVFDQEMLIMAKIKGLKIVQLPIPTIYSDEVSHLKPISYGLNVLSVVSAYKRGHYHRLDTSYLTPRGFLKGSTLKAPKI